MQEPPSLQGRAVLRQQGAVRRLRLVRRRRRLQPLQQRVLPLQLAVLPLPHQLPERPDAQRELRRLQQPDVRCSLLRLGH